MLCVFHSKKRGINHKSHKGGGGALLLPAKERSQNTWAFVPTIIPQSVVDRELRRIQALEPECRIATSRRWSFRPSGIASKDHRVCLKLNPRWSPQLLQSYGCMTLTCLQNHSGGLFVKNRLFYAGDNVSKLNGSGFLPRISICAVYNVGELLICDSFQAQTGTLGSDLLTRETKADRRRAMILSYIFVSKFTSNSSQELPRIDILSFAWKSLATT